MEHSPTTPRTLRNLSEAREVRKNKRSITPEVDLTSRKLQMITADWLSFKVHSKPRNPRSLVSPSSPAVEPRNSKRLAAVIKSASVPSSIVRSSSTPRSKLLFENQGRRRLVKAGSFTMTATQKQFAVDLTSTEVDRGRKRKPKTFEVSLYD
jgi:hypothetical protein